MVVFNYSRHILISFLLLLSSFSVTADDYLDMLNVEAEDLSLDKSGQLSEFKEANVSGLDGITIKNWKWQGELEEGEIPVGLAQDEFATILKQSFLGSFVYYRRLNAASQKAVYDTYHNISHPNIDVVRRAILNRY